MTFYSLPVNGDQGFPQSFRLALGGSTYTVTLYVNVVEEIARPSDHVYDLAHDRGAFMVMRVAREGGAAPAVILQSKLLPEHEYRASELAFRFGELLVNRRNLNGVGSFGSAVRGEVGLRWAS